MYTTNSYAPGGRIKRGKMILAHFNPHELNALDHWQGKRETCPRTGMRSYAHLEELLKNPHILNNVVSAVQQHAATGGSMAAPHEAHGGRLHDYHNAKLNHMADQGVHGDTEIALIGPHTRNVFDHLVKMTHPHLAGLNNPHTGHPHYGFLDSIIGGIGSVLSPIVNTVRKIPLIGNIVGGLADSLGGAVQKHAPAMASAAGSLAQKYLPQIGQQLGGETGARYASMAGNFLNDRLGQMGTPEQQAQGQQWASQASNMGQGLADAYRRGGMRGMAGTAMQGIGDMAGGQFGGMASQLGQGIQQGQGFGTMARNMGAGALGQLAKQYGGQFGDMANQFGQGLQQGRNPFGMMRDMGQQYLGGMMPQMSAPMMQGQYE